MVRRRGGPGEGPGEGGSGEGGSGGGGSGEGGSGKGSTQILDAPAKILNRQTHNTTQQHTTTHNNTNRRFGSIDTSRTGLSRFGPSRPLAHVEKTLIGPSRTGPSRASRVSGVSWVSRVSVCVCVVSVLCLV